MEVIRLLPGKDGSLLRRHPWIFSGAIASVSGNPAAGETVSVLASDGKWLARAAYSPASQIRARVWSFDPKEDVTPDWFDQRIGEAAALRSANPTIPAGAARLVHSESDGLPGLIVDRYGDFLVCQFLSAGAEHWKDEIVERLARHFPCAGIYERSDADSREKEGFPPCSGVLRGDPPPELIEITEGPCRFLVDVVNGHKTGFYLDQRQNRAWVGQYAAGRTVLNCFSYTGGFGISALAGGAAHVAHLDSSPEALALAARNVDLNGFDPARSEGMQGDAFQVLRRFMDSRRRFDLIVLDPPKFASSKAQLPGACRGYKDINRLAIKLLNPGGLLFTFSCSGLLDAALFQKIVADAALDAGRQTAILQHLSQAPDHPVSLNFPEGAYLKGLICRAL